jgi:HPt (histidine-containing phosphotransfer) domain-containing protein
MLLTDLHMPDMDGYALAEAIRQEEISKGTARKDRMPILALTANALRGEAIRAQAIGMDEYLTKPLQLESLRAAIERWLRRSSAAVATIDSREQASKSPSGWTVDVSMLESLVGSDPKVVQEFLSDYRTTSSRLSIELGSARAAGDIRRIVEIAHRLKSSSRAVGALALGDLCAELENVCRSGAVEAALGGTLRLEAALREMEEEICGVVAGLVAREQGLPSVGVSHWQSTRH